MAKLKRDGENDTTGTATVGEGIVVNGVADTSASVASAVTPAVGSDPATSTAPAKTRKPRTPRDPNAPRLDWNAEQFQELINVLDGIQNATIAGSLTPSAVTAALKKSAAFSDQDKTLLTPVKVKAAVRKLQKHFDDDLKNGKVSADEYVQLPELTGDGRKTKIPTLDLMAYARSLAEKRAQASA